MPSNPYEPPKTEGKPAGNRRRSNMIREAVGWAIVLGAFAIGTLIIGAVLFFESAMQ